MVFEERSQLQSTIGSFRKCVLSNVQTCIAETRTFYSCSL
jgi:hypothetical protein